MTDQPTPRAPEIHNYSRAPHCEAPPDRARCPACSDPEPSAPDDLREQKARLAVEYAERVYGQDAVEADFGAIAPVIQAFEAGFAAALPSAFDDLREQIAEAMHKISTRHLGWPTRDEYGVMAAAVMDVLRRNGTIVEDSNT